MAEIILTVFRNKAKEKGQTNHPNLALSKRYAKSKFLSDLSGSENTIFLNKASFVRRVNPNKVFNDPNIRKLVYLFT